MLQWMGGSRKKVTTSRKSTQTRQKQYFEQRKRQQQSLGLENYDQGRSACSQYNEGLRSLDALTLTHVAVPFDGHSTYAAAKADLDANNAKMDNLPLLSFPSKIDGIASKDPRTGPKLGNYKPEVVLPRSDVTSCGVHSSHITTDERDGTNRLSEQQLSVLELFGDDGYREADRKSTKEAHVSFSVEGLGKVGMETPVHSPKDSGRVLFNGRSSPSVDREIQAATKKLKCDVDNFFHVKKDGRVHGYRKSLEKVFQSPKVVGHSQLAKYKNMGCTLEDLYDPPIDDVLRGTQKLCCDNEEKSYQRWNGDSGFPCENFFDDTNDEVLWKTQPFIREKRNGKCDYGFEDTFVVSSRNLDRHKKYDGSVPDLWQMHLPAQGFQCNATEDSYDFVLDGNRHGSASEIQFHKSEAISQNPFSAFGPEIAEETMSLSDESSSTTGMMSSHTKLKQLKSRNKKPAGIYDSELNCFGSKESFDMGQNTNMPRKLQQRFEDKFNSFDLDVVTSPLHETSMQEETRHVDYMFWNADDLLSPNLSPNICLNQKPFCMTPKSGGSVPVDRLPSDGFFIHKDLSEESARPVHQQHLHPPSSSVLHSKSQIENEQEICVNMSGKNLSSLQEEKFTVKSDSSIANGKTVDSYSECEQEAQKDEDLVDHIGTRESPEYADNMQEADLKKVSENLKSCIRDKMSNDNGVPVPLQIVKRETRAENVIVGGTNIKSKGHPGADQSYQVILESCFLQLMCVQRVLSETSARGSQKKQE